MKDGNLVVSVIVIVGFILWLVAIFTEEQEPKHYCARLGCNYESSPGSRYCYAHKYSSNNTSTTSSKNKSNSSSSTSSSSSSSKSNSTSSKSKSYTSSSKKSSMPDCDDYDSYDDFMDDWDGCMPDGSDAEDYWENW